jgi:hypothetical protein
VALSKAERYARDFGPHAEWIRAQQCSVPACTVPHCDPHHVRSRGAGGTSRDLVPLCREHHGQVHHYGRITFENMYRVNLILASVLLWSKSPHGGAEVFGVPV